MRRKYFLPPTAGFASSLSQLFFPGTKVFFHFGERSVTNFLHLWFMLLCPNLPEALVFTPGRRAPHLFNAGTVRDEDLHLTVQHPTASAPFVQD